jgi:hypothetical protein
VLQGIGIAKYRYNPSAVDKATAEMATTLIAAADKQLQAVTTKAKETGTKFATFSEPVSVLVKPLPATE